MTETGLLAANAPVPLEGVSVEASIRDGCAQVTVSQRYRNREAAPIEAVYVFPLDEGAALFRFEALIDGRHVAGEVKEREEAFNRYDDALSRGHGAYLLDEERPDVFTARIGNVPPGKEVTVRLSYVTELEREGEEYRFVLPTTVSPRYAPAEDRRGVGPTPEVVLNPPVDWEVPYGLSLIAHLEMSSSIRAIESPSHPLKLDLDGARATVELGSRESALDRDFVLRIRKAEPEAPRVEVEVDEAGRRAALVSFLPRFEVEDAPSEILFVVDRSGSMQGSSIAEARTTLELCLRSLNPRIRFNVLGFGTDFVTLFEESRPYTDESLAAASAHVKGLDADLGGTEILAPLRALLEKPLHPGLPRQIFVLTDGQVTNTAAVIELLARHAATTRVFAFGIGAGASRHLVRGMARAGRGAAEFISPGERIEAKVLRQLGKALTPALTDVKVDWGGLPVRQAPHHVPPVFAGEEVRIYALLEDARAGDVTLTAASPGGPLAFKLRLDPEYRARGSLLGRLAARGLIRDLEEGTSPLHKEGALREGVTAEQVKAEIVRLGVGWSLPSRETSFVAVETRETPVEGELQVRKVPIALTRGWGDLEQEFRMPLASKIHGLSPGSTTGFVNASLATPSLRLGSRNVSSPEGDFLAPSIPLRVSPPTRREVPSLRPLDRLVALQRADGSWELTKELASVLGRPLAELEKALPKGAGPREEALRAWATALALLWLKTEASNAVGEWFLLEKKARKWLGSCGARGDWLEAAATFFSV